MPDPFKNRAQLIERALKNLGIIEPGEAPSSEDSDTMDGLIDPLIAQLDSDQIVSITNPDEIELKYFMPLARLLANAAGPDFGSPMNDPARLADEKTLRRLTSTPPTYEVQKGEYF